jgi:uncharacterized membrane protein YjgN (DUF898 family)
MTPQSELITPTEQTYRLEFTGSAGEYFRIWIVNVFLTVVTLGIYYAWAKVRTRRYLYAHTMLDGHAFDYLANPIALLKGHLILATGFMSLILVQQFLAQYEGVIVLVFYAVMPYLVYKSLRFRLFNSAYRNIRMHFRGSARESYRIYFWWSTLIPLTLGLIFPYIIYRKKKYLFEHVAYGTTQNSFTGTQKPFYAMYLAASGILILVILICLFIASLFSGVAIDLIKSNPDTMTLLVAMGYLTMLFTGVLMQQFLYSRTHNYCWNNSTLGHIHFQSSLKTWSLVGIRMTNLLAIICSLGLLIPWARVRGTRYMLSRIQLIASGDLDHFTAAQGSDAHALGDVSADFLDIEIGL